MISNSRKNMLNPPNRIQNSKAKISLRNIISTGNTKLIKASIYKGEYTKDGIKKNETRERLQEIYYNKCAYCEIKKHKPEIEHYRPKAKVKEDHAHNGYYWLCYEWSNLLPSCRYCNTEGGKGNKFPIMGIRVNKPSFTATHELDLKKCKATQSPLIDEKPYLLNPEIDMPETCFVFLTNGEIKGIDTERRGEKTIDICNLNRSVLKWRRQKLIGDFIESFQDRFVLFLENSIDKKGLKASLNQVFHKMKNAQNPQKEFSLVAQYCYANFDETIASAFPSELQKGALSNAFEQYKNETL